MIQQNNTSYSVLQPWHYAMSYCNNRNITIFPVIVSRGVYQIIIRRINKPDHYVNGRYYEKTKWNKEGEITQMCFDTKIKQLYVEIAKRLKAKQSKTKIND